MYISIECACQETAALQKYERNEWDGVEIKQFELIFKRAKAIQRHFRNMSLNLQPMLLKIKLNYPTLFRYFSW